MTCALSPILIVAMTAADRWAGARTGTQDVLARWQVWVPVLVAIVVGLGLILAYRKWDEQHKMRRSFLSRTNQFGLTQTERQIVTRMVQMADLRRWDTLFLSREVFESAANRFVMSPRVAALESSTRDRLTEAVDTIRAKIGFNEKERVEDAITAAVDLQPGLEVSLIRAAGASEVEATIEKVAGANLRLTLKENADVAVGNGCVVRITRNWLHWEYSAVVDDVRDGRVALTLLGTPRCVELRRFLRVETQMPARVAPFPFVRDGGLAEPTWSQGTVTEIAGPGFRVETALDADVGGRVLIILGTDKVRSLQGTARVRRVLEEQDGVRSLGVEVVGLTEDEVSALVRETNRAAREVEKAEAAGEPVIVGAEE